MSKKRILFIIDSLRLAGAEKSLVTLLNLLDPDRLEIDLQLFSYGGELESMLPEYVHLLPKLPFYEACEGSLIDTIRKAPHRKKIKYLISRSIYSLSLRIGQHTNQEEAILFWKHCGGCFEKSWDRYDYAVAYGQNVPTYYLADCIFPLEKRIAWVNANYSVNGLFHRYAFEKYKKVDIISCVSEDAKNTFSESFPEYRDKLVITKDIYDGRFIQRMAGLPSAAPKEMKKGAVRLLTIGRLAPEKGYDIAVEACKILAESGLDFAWYVLGSGPLEDTIKKEIKANSLEGKMILLGTRSNPYPYIKNADIYVQTSKREAFGLAIAEARVLNVPVVSTNFPAINEQIKDGVNGLIVKMNPSSVAEGIKNLLLNQELFVKIKEWLQSEIKENSNEIKKLYDLLECEDGHL